MIFFLFLFNFFANFDHFFQFFDKFFQKKRTIFHFLEGSGHLWASFFFRKWLNLFSYFPVLSKAIQVLWKSYFQKFPAQEKLSGHSFDVKQPAKVSGSVLSLEQPTETHFLAIWKQQEKVTKNFENLSKKNVFQIPFELVKNGILGQWCQPSWLFLEKNCFVIKKFCWLIFWNELTCHLLPQGNGSIVENFFEEKLLIFEKNFDQKNEKIDFESFFDPRIVFTS